MTHILLLFIIISKVIIIITFNQFSCLLLSQNMSKWTAYSELLIKLFETKQYEHIELF